MVEETATGHSTGINGIYKDCVLEVSVLAVLGQEVWLQRGEASDFKVMMELGYNINHGRNVLRHLYYMPSDMFISYHFPWLVKAIYWLRPGWYLSAFRSLKTIILDCIRDRREKAKSQQLQEKSVLDVIVAASETEENGQLSDIQILSHCLNFLFAAYDTTSLTLTCASHLLATNTHVQNKLCALLDDYWSQHQDASVSTVAQEVPYLDMVIDETMRLYPPGPRIARICQEKC
jgi:cytochrome P450